MEEEKKNGYPIQIRKLNPIQMPHIDMDQLKQGRKAFSYVSVLEQGGGKLIPGRFIRFPRGKAA